MKVRLHLLSGADVHINGSELLRADGPTDEYPLQHNVSFPFDLADVGWMVIMPQGACTLELVPDDGTWQGGNELATALAARKKEASK